MRRSKIELFREAVTTVVALLSGKNIPVIQEGTRACVRYDGLNNPIQVQIPYLADDAPESTIDAIMGFIDHEVGHILFTDPAPARSLSESIEPKHRKRYLFINNIVEDPYVENNMKRKYFGSGINIANVSQFFIQTSVLPALESAMSPEQRFGVLLNPIIRAWSGQQIFEDFIAEHTKGLEPFIARIAHIKPDLALNGSAEGSSAFGAKIAKDLLDAILDMNADDDSDATDGAKSDGRDKGESTESSDSDGDYELDDDFEGEDASEPIEGELPDRAEDGDGDHDDEGDDESDSSGDESPESGEDESEDTDAGMTAETEGETDAASDGGEEGKGADSDVGSTSSETEGKYEDDSDGEPDASDDSFEPISADLDALMDSMLDTDESLSKAISESAARAMKRSTYPLYTTARDRIGEKVAVPRKDSPMLRSALEKLTVVENQVGTIQKHLERSMQARSMSVWQTGYNTGRLRSANVVGAIMGRERPFSRKQVSRAKDVAVSLLIDCSGSMTSDGKIVAAVQSGYALSKVLDRMNIQHEVIGFTTYHDPEFASSSKLVNAARMYPLYMPLLKGFDERLTPGSRDRFGQLLVNDILHENVDGECVEIAAKRLAMRKSERKILMVLSDGSPCCPGDRMAQVAHLNRTVKKVSDAGIEVLGIGILDSSVSKFYKNHVVLDSIDSLATTVVKELESLLLQGIK